MSSQKNLFIGAYLHVKTESTLYELVGEEFVNVLSQINTEYWDSDPKGLLLLGNQASDGTWFIGHNGCLINLNFNKHIMETLITQFENFYVDIIKVITQKVGKENINVCFGYAFYLPNTFQQVLLKN